MDTRAFIVPLHDLDDAGKTFDFEIPVSWLKAALKDCEMRAMDQDGRLQVHVSKTGTDVLVHGTIDVSLVIACARCLTDVVMQPKIDLSLVLEPAHPEVSNLPHARRLPRADARVRSVGDSGAATVGKVASGRGGATIAGPKGDVSGGRSASSRAVSLRDGRKGKADPGKEESWESASELNPDQMDADTYEGDELVLDRFVWEAVLLESPIFPLCSETCEGIRPGQAIGTSDMSGGDPDPRLARLIEFSELAKKRLTKE